MFQRFTEKARRVIFFARYEAGGYGSPSIETEHLLLGLLREGALNVWFPGESNAEAKIRAEIERRIHRGEPLGTSVEIPLSPECTAVLNFAVNSAERLGHPQVEMEHILIGILRVETCLAAWILKECGLGREDGLSGTSPAEG